MGLVNVDFLLFRDFKKYRNSAPRNYEEGLAFIKEYGKEKFHIEISKKMDYSGLYYFYIVFLLFPVYLFFVI